MRVCVWVGVWTGVAQPKRSKFSLKFSLFLHYLLYMVLMPPVCNAMTANHHTVVHCVWVLCFVFVHPQILFRTIKVWITLRDWVSPVRSSVDMCRVLKPRTRCKESPYTLWSPSPKSLSNVCIPRIQKRLKGFLSGIPDTLLSAKLTHFTCQCHCQHHSGAAVGR